MILLKSHTMKPGDHNLKDKKKVVKGGSSLSKLCVVEVKLRHLRRLRLKHGWGSSQACVLANRTPLGSRNLKDKIVEDIFLLILGVHGCY